MTVPVQARAARRAPVAGSALAPALAGLAFLVARPGLEALPAGARTGVLAAGYLALGLAAAAATPAGRPAAAATPARGTAAAAPARGAAGAVRRPGAAPASRPRAGAVLVVGVAAVVAAALLAGPVPPLPAGVVALALSLLAAVAEEALFRGALYGLLERRGAVVAVGTSALLFALVHVPSYGLAAMPVDLGAGLLFGWQRWASDRWTVPAATHAAANLLAVILR
jgi:membrane protease YdiL (CAAX protease family)